MDADEMDIDLDGAGAADKDSLSASPASASGSFPAVLSELAALHRRASSSSPPLSLPSITYLSSAPASVASLFPCLAAAGIPASSLLPPLEASLSAHPLPAAVAYLRLLLAPASPLLTLFSPLPFLSLLRSIRKAASSSAGAANPSSGSGGGRGNPRKRKNQRHQPAAAPQAAPSRALSLLADAAGRLPLRAHPDARRSLVDTAAELAAFDVLAAVLGSDYHAEEVQDVVRALGSEEREGFATYVVDMSKGKAKERLLAVDLMLAILPVLLPSDGDDCDLEEVKFLRVLVERCSDSVGGVRARALTNAAQAIGLIGRPVDESLLCAMVPHALIH
ncbi:condensin-2 complex subunit D3 [Panicum miliaceum]|uniref:Condensin-2 complex subunit D3 n=1 Tax=Panicum miliaceum TaxID=4540 RepID=A0A3L6PHB6_PANMI|nr:condensin-2 complex subunit D3 [Panicum miliaceum]